MKPAALINPREAVMLTGVTEVAAPAIAEKMVGAHSAPVSILLVKNQRQLEQWAEEIEFFRSLGDSGTTSEIRILPDLSKLDPEDPRYFDLECDRLAALTRLNDYRFTTDTGEPLIVITTPHGLLQPVPPREALAAREIRLVVGENQAFKDLVDHLSGELNYDSEALCETPGQYAVRGGLIDVYPVNESQPYRIDFFGDEIDEIRAFDPTTQRSLEKVDQIVIASLVRGVVQERERNIFDYLGDRINWLFWEPSVLTQEFPSLFNYPEKIAPALPTFQELFEHRDAYPDRWLALADLDTEDTVFGSECIRQAQFTEPLGNYRTYALDSEFGQDRVQAEQEARLRFLRQVLEWQNEGFAIVCVTHNAGEENRLREILQDENNLRQLQPRFVRGLLREGFRLRYGESGGILSDPAAEGSPGVVVMCDSEIFGRYRTRPVGGRRRRLPQRAQVDQLLDFSELAEGDFLVHLQHGICIYRGITRMEVRGKKDEVISLEFDEGIQLHLPLHESHLLTRYVGLSKMRPRLGKLGAGLWDKTRRAAEKATLDFAAELLNMQAKRNLVKGHAFAPDSEWQHEFEESFTFRETPDQEKAIIEAKQDMEQEQPMDRLICGDVGFGKTEVAIRAAFKSVMDGKQVAVLVPTTVLAQQHFNTFKERMADYPVAVEMISRFRTKGQQTEILGQLREGRIDIIIGTHRILSKDIGFADLGLLIIDEEHRFGVRHKEKLKRMRENVDVMTMSATPIPRTLYLALMGARDLSVIETPPVDRLPIQTVVKTYDLKLIKEAITYEVDRGGQVFYLHNRVDSIDSVALKLKEILPTLRIAVGHGQMEENQLEKFMTRFVAGEFDVLVCTTIIESGLDIPNCNTLIIEGADRFGLSQLYQLRGRVGRFRRQAYAYLLLHRHTQLLDQARKRLTALRQYNQLGAGFKIAMRDLELRGAGNLLGAQQSGHIAGVGFELYCQLLRQSISRLKGEAGADRIRASLRLDFVTLGEGDSAVTAAVREGYGVLREAELADERIESISAHIPYPYIGETRLRIDFYRRLALADTVKAVQESAEALEDRFGKYPKPVEALLLVTEIRCLAEEKNILAVETEGDRLKCLRASGIRDDFIKTGNRFPRLTRRKALARLKEIRTFLKRTVSKEQG